MDEKRYREISDRYAADQQQCYARKWVIANSLPPLGAGGSSYGYNLVGVLNVSNKEPLPQSQHCKLVLEFPLTRRMRSL